MRRAHAVLALAGLFAAAGCRSQAPPREVVVAVSSGALTLEPNAVNEEITLSLLSNVYETLVELDPDLGVRPGLARSWATVDDLTWVFRLREGVRLHDGRALHAADVARSLEHAWRDPSSRRRLQLEPLLSVQARDRRTLVVRTRRPFDALASRLGNVLIAVPAADGTPVGSGPYRVQAWTPGGDAHLRAFEGYDGPAPWVRDVRLRVIPEPSAQVSELVAGRVHLLLDVAQADLARLRAEPRVRVSTRAGLRIVFLGMDTAREVSPYVEAPRNPFRDARVRRALGLALDAEALVRGPLGGLGEVVDQIAAPLEWRRGRIERGAAARDPEQARHLLAAAGYPSGFQVSLHYMPRKYRGTDEVVAQLARDLEAVGVRLVPQPVSTAEMLARVERRDVSLYLLGWIGDADPILAYQYLLHTPVDGFGVLNGGAYSNPVLDALVLEAAGRLTPSQRRERLAEAARLVREDAPLLPLYRELDAYAFAADLEFAPRLDRHVRAATLRWR